MIASVRRASVLLWLAAILPLGVVLHAQEARVTLSREGQTIVLEPYAPNILRVTLSLKREPAVAAPGYGFIATTAAAGWSASQTEQADVYKSAGMVVTVDRPQPSSEAPVQTQTDIGNFFDGSTPGAHIVFRAPDGKKLLELTGWSQDVPNQKEGTAGGLRGRRPGRGEFLPGCGSLPSAGGEPLYGLGQNHEGFLDHRGHA